MSAPPAPNKDTVFAWIADERRRLSEALSTLDANQLAQPSLCGGWSVAECAAHLTAGINASWAKFGKEMLKAFGNFDKANNAITRDLANLGHEQICTDLREQAENTFTPPGAGPEAPLADLTIHSQEIFRPLGITYPTENDRVAYLLPFFENPKFRKVMNGPSVDGTRLMAEDIDWTHGAGAEVTGPGVSILLALAGRKWATEDLTGEGLEMFRSNFS